MRSSLLPGFLIAALLAASPAVGQIGDDDSSYNLLAVQCLISAKRAGRTDVTLSSYDQYATSLAKTISFLSPTAQDRVFNPVTGGGSTIINTGGDGASVLHSASGATKAKSNYESANMTSSESGSSGMLSDMGDAILSGVTSFNDFIDGQDEVPEPLMGVAVDPDTLADSSGSDSSGSDSSGSGEPLLLASAAPVLYAAVSSEEAKTTYSARRAASSTTVASISAQEPTFAAIPASDVIPETAADSFEVASAADFVSDEIGDVLAVRSEEEYAAISNAVETGSVEDLSEAAENSGFDFWGALKKFIGGVIDHFEENGSKYEEYIGN